MEAGGGGLPCACVGALGRENGASGLAGGRGAACVFWSVARRRLRVLFVLIVFMGGMHAGEHCPTCCTM